MLSSYLRQQSSLDRFNIVGKILGGSSHCVQLNSGMQLNGVSQFMVLTLPDKYPHFI